MNNDRGICKCQNIGKAQLTRYEEPLLISFLWFGMFGYDDILNCLRVFD